HQIKLQSYQSFSQFCRERKCDSVNWEEREDDLQKMESLNHHRRDLRRYHRLRRRRQSYCQFGGYLRNLEHICELEGVF
ncbi:hypothetical protein KSS87_010503, partial [Heliosperma pusillum]